MEGNQFSVSETEFNGRIADITDKYYQNFFDECDRLVSEIELKTESPAAERILSRLDMLISEFRQLFYKEKLILFPFLEKSYSADGLIELPFSVSQLAAVSDQLGEKITRFAEEFIRSESVSADSITDLMDRICMSWRRISQQKNSLYSTFNQKKIRKE